jgi:glucose/arabinose dehydrogenase
LGAGVDGSAEIRALSLGETGLEIVNDEDVATGLNTVLGLAFDPGSSQQASVLYASHREQGDQLPYRGHVRAFEGPGWQGVDIISGLPDFPGDQHQTNGLAFDELGRLLIAQGSMTSSGTLGESPLSAAILVADVHDPSFHGDVTYDVTGLPRNDQVNQVSGDVNVFASGLRNPYDLVVHTNGRVYATDNGPFPGFATSSSCTEANATTSGEDELNLIEEGAYYGHPNRNRGRYNPEECIYHAPNEPSSGKYRAPLVIMPRGSSCNGIAEYTSDAFNGELRGDLLCAGTGDGALRRTALSPDGSRAQSMEVIASDMPFALDVAVRRNGTMYVSGRDAIYVLTPANPAVPGDANCNDSVTPIDAALALQTIAGLLDEPPCPYNADVNADGAIDAVDAALVLQYVAGLLDHLPP